MTADNSNPPTVDWKALADDPTPSNLSKLDRVIAKRLGYHAFQLSNRIWVIITKHEGYLISDVKGFNALTEDRAWEEQCPRYTTDLNEAINLPTGEHELRLSIVDGLPMATVKTNTAIEYTISDASPALAICVAWLEWKDATR